jgi:hypothetical protein
MQEVFDPVAFKRAGYPSAANAGTSVMPTQELLIGRDAEALHLGRRGHRKSWFSSVACG